MTPLQAATAPSGHAPPSNGERHGRPFTLRLEPEQEDKLRRELARLELLPFNERPRELFGWDAGGGAGRRRASLGWFLVWAALQHCAAAGRTRASSHGKTRRKAKRAGRVPAKRAKRSKKGGRR